MDSIGLNIIEVNYLYVDAIIIRLLFAKKGFRGVPDFFENTGYIGCSAQGQGVILGVQFAQNDTQKGAPR